MEDFITKSYLHFDYRTRYNSVKDYVENPQRIIKHGFFPFIHKKKVLVKYKVNGAGERPVKIKPRELYRASHLDSCIYRYYADRLNKDYEKVAEVRNIDENVAAYRSGKGKSNIDYAAETMDFIKRTNDGCFIFLGDFEKFFDTLDHKYLKSKLKEVLNTNKLTEDWFKIFKTLTSFSWVEQKDLNDLFGSEKEQYKNSLKTYFETWEEFRSFKADGHVHKNTKPFGIPQGTPISALLSNIYMIDFDDWLNRLSSKYEGKYLRYADDFILILPFSTTSKDVYLEIVNEILQYASDVTKLKIEKNKTEKYLFKNDTIYLFESNKTDTSSLVKSKLDYLGFVFDGRNVKMRQKSVSKFYRKADKAIRTAREKSRIKKSSYLIGKRHIYRYFFDEGARDSKGSKFGNFISYARRCQKKFDQISPMTENLMMEQIKNRRKKLLKKMHRS
ncbi:reverse transcriptase/maturase family protein [Enterococcus raffinosus]|uniref:reverse transcriptase/maturase family protein n=1 Tax=Enterococcus raffinosus TaxID=71452 RepID=UPI001C98CF9E|nr:reverse transcriptase/maturase family protein [Enterococcus raffinosus]QZO09263.1 reverse transcriptase/maturase family protein [Enterococcus raffinosus]